ncbi:hypothetical protein [Novosphingobium sp. KN65.2]|uniref:hypothetical protein n=1 Tax=Novosphingobium sp. KN65.2 TaxID=1478134 RepID=UPI0005E5E690|nr:hypothetical protein [Novosphingobium sp. KN65.2]CDO36063.1 hypothetical protein SPHV1_230002 [Novosphingobium sp. KN65.2]
MTLYAATELHELYNTGTAVETTTSNRFDGTYGIRNAWYAGSTVSDYVSAVTPGSSGLGSFTTFWMAFYVYRGNTWQSGSVGLELYNSSGTPVFRIYHTSNDVAQAQYWNGSSWVNIGSSYTVSGNPLLRFDFKIVCGASGSFEWYINSSIYTSGSASMTSVTNIDEWRVRWAGGTGRWHVSECIWGDEATIGHRYCIAAPTGDGFYTAGSGSYTDVDESTTNDGDATTLTNNGDAETYTHSAMTLPSGTVKLVQVSARVRSAATGAQNVKARLRKSSTNYDQASNYAGIGAGYTAYRARWTTDPATGSAWTQANAQDTAQNFGLVAQT